MAFLFLVTRMAINIGRWLVTLALASKTCPVAAATLAVYVLAGLGGFLAMNGVSTAG